LVEKGQWVESIADVSLGFWIQIIHLLAVGRDGQQQNVK